MVSWTSNVFLLLVGPSGTGKSYVADNLCKALDIKQVESYTNRPPRYKGEAGHTFLKEKDIDKIKKKYPNRVAETVFDGHFYFATAEQVEQCGVYVISPDAIEQFKENYQGKKKVKVVAIHTPPFLRKVRMEARGDAPEAIAQRIEHDKQAFSGVEDVADLVAWNITDNDAVDEVLAALKKWGVKFETSKN